MVEEDGDIVRLSCGLTVTVTDLAELTPPNESVTVT